MPPTDLGSAVVAGTEGAPTGGVQVERLHSEPDKCGDSSLEEPPG
jgi:hypothetical protein